jgi:2-C-methyl-D-erythritol 4-phosphate cytidylyltransferase
MLLKMPAPTASVIIPAAGVGQRFAQGLARRREVPSERLSKVFVPLAGRPVLARTLDQFGQVAAVAEIVVAVSPETLEWARHEFGSTFGGDRPLTFVAGGSNRTESVSLALAATDGGTELVAIHDAVRPMIRPKIIEEALRVAIEHGAAVVGRPVDHTVKSVPNGHRVAETLPRAGLWLAQTPQVFRREILMQAYERREDVVGQVTDDAKLVEAMGQAVMMVLGDAANLKITTPEDLRFCEALLAAGWPFGE